MRGSCKRRGLQKKNRGKLSTKPQYVAALCSVGGWRISLNCPEPAFFHTKALCKPITASGCVNITGQKQFCVEKAMGSAICWVSVAPFLILCVNMCSKTTKLIPLRPVNSSLLSAIHKECIIRLNKSNLSIPEAKELSTGRYSNSEMIWSVQLIFKWWLWRLWDLGSVICISINTSSETLKCCWRANYGFTNFINFQLNFQHGSTLKCDMDQCSSWQW